MAQQKISARQVSDAAAAALADAKAPAPDPSKKPKGGKPEGFTGDRPGWFRGVRIKR